MIAMQTAVYIHFILELSAAGAYKHQLETINE